MLKSTSRSFSGKDNLLNQQSVNIKGRNLLTAEELSVLKMGEIITKKTRYKPVFSKFQPFYTLKLPIQPLADLGLYNDTVLAKKLFPFHVITGTKETAQDKSLSVRSSRSNDDNEVSLLEVAVKEINYNTSNKFSFMLDQQDYKSCLKIINTFRLNKLIDKQKLDAISEWLDVEMAE